MTTTIARPHGLRQLRGGEMANELETLRAKLAKREGVPGYEENVRELRERIAELEKQPR